MKNAKKWVALLLMMLALLGGCGRTAPGQEESVPPVRKEASVEESAGEKAQPEETPREEAAPPENLEVPSEAPSSGQEEGETAADSEREAQKPAQWDQILTDMAPYLENVQEQDMSTEERIQANVGLGHDQIAQAVLYMGMPMETPNTTYFFMGQMAHGADSQKICDKLNQVMTGWVETYKQGRLTGNAEYDIIVSGELAFAVMHENAEDFADICAYLKAQ